MIRFTIPGEPQGKGRARIVRIGGFSRMATPAKTLAYEGLVAQMAQQAMGAAPLLEGAVTMRCRLLFSVPRSASKRATADMLDGTTRPTKKPDADNVLKAICDGCNGVVFKDDSQVTDVRVTKEFSPVPGVIVEIEPLQPGARPSPADAARVGAGDVPPSLNPVARGGGESARATTAAAP